MTEIGVRDVLIFDEYRVKEDIPVCRYFRVIGDEFKEEAKVIFLEAKNGDDE